MPNSRMTLRAPAHVVDWTLILLVALAAPGATSLANAEARYVQPIRTAKERLGSKASDEQRVVQGATRPARPETASGRMRQRRSERGGEALRGVLVPTEN
jgi:hypothetical protein